jgi:signal transduction histidine kinase
MVDNQENVWANTSIGILKINRTRDNVQIYGQAHGIDVLKTSGPQFVSVCGKGSDGKLYFPDKTGYYEFIPEKIAIDTIAPQIAVTAFRLKNKLISYSPDGLLDQPLSQLGELKLKYNENSFEFDIIAIHFIKPENNRLNYFLENSDDSWHQGDSEEKAYYNNVAPGRYVFRIRAYNVDGAWSEKDIVIIISLPWWSTWWAYVLYAVILAAIIYAFFRNRINSLRIKQEEQLHTMVATQEEERKRISRDLHDDVGTKLSALRLFISSFKNNIGYHRYQEAEILAGNAEELINETMKDVREMLLNLSPTVLEEFGYTTAVEGLVNKINIARVVNFNLVLFGMNHRLPKEYELALYRITQELINNVLKHSEAKNVSLQIGYRDQRIVLMIEDDGKGFDISAHKNGYGLKNLEARTKLLGGTMNIDARPGNGTRILIEIPFQY